MSGAALSVLTVLCTLAGNLANPVIDQVVVYRRTSAPPGWKQVSRAHPAQKMRLLIGLKQRNLDWLVETFYDVSDPQSPNYQNFLSSDQILDKVAPEPAVLEAVREWIESSYLKHTAVTAAAAGRRLLSFSPRRDSLAFEGTVSLVEYLFGTEVHIFTHERRGESILRQMGPYSIPKAVLQHIDVIEGLSDFPMEHDTVRYGLPGGPILRDDARHIVVPQMLYSLYNIPKKPTTSKVSQGCAEFQNDNSYSPQDLAYFLNETSLSGVNVSHIVGPFNPEFPDIEATLDVQWIIAAGMGAEDWYWTTRGWMFTFSNNFFHAASVPEVVSISWGWSEVQQCSAGIDPQGCQIVGGDARTYVSRVNSEFMKIGLRGVTLIVSSGDSGANGRTDYTCHDPQFHPTFPGASPAVTSVGATQFHNYTLNLTEGAPPVCKEGPFVCYANGTEEAVSYRNAGFTSGGGFSVFSNTPKYQEPEIANYLSGDSEVPPFSYFNPEGRGYPDISAFGTNYLIRYDRSWSTAGGTSASAPVIAGVVSHLNDLSYKKTGKPLGFINPLLYQMAREHPKAYNDVLLGDNVCTELGCRESCKGFYAAKGWDPVTGLGTPNTIEMLAYVDSLMDRRQKTFKPAAKTAPSLRAHDQQHVIHI
ncbi:unnamed protein product [Vitrella brassicaformis CCMP3155]|uniref:subtilisin n=1 Tax=Vitrella brassicaformis (strain CCMP3155) TaxID=1169540 RepID=A0A0G4EVI0_VITBC|nr:unnamed protein product [Vitrella brassicaformis CCMP3155]|eukprot:CEM02085.1 unnamed protein product [Vitrella brassicaformis CCMP3155]